MRTTVGPLPSSVYWRRRAVVLGAVLLGIIVLFVSCSGGGDKGSPHGRAASDSSSLPASTPSATSSPDDQPSFLDPGSGNGPALPDPSSVESRPPGAGNPTGAPPTSQPPGGTGTNTNVTVANDGSCTDASMSVTPVPSATTLQRGSSVELTIKIKNTGARTCSRDVGADPQELYLNQGARKYWSSDDCSAATGHDVRQFAPGAERDYKITWNGRQSSSCAAGAPSGPTPPDGQFQLRARLGSLVSAPATITFVG